MKRGAIEDFAVAKKQCQHPLIPHPKGLKFEYEPEKRAIERVLNGESVLITASAGFGKSTLADYLIFMLRRIHGDDAVYVTASTGVAAVRLGEGAMTLHSFAGFQLGISNRTEERLTPEQCVARMKPNIRQRWDRTKVLVVDEVSMLDEAFFTQVKSVAEIVKKNKAVFFGGIQVICIGDFFQLRPVKGNFVFTAPYWDRFIGKSGTVVLTHPYRQSDEHFLRVLEKIKIGNIDEEARELMSQCRRSFTEREGYSENWTIVNLVPHRKTAEVINERALEALKKPIHEYNGRFSGSPYYKKNIDNILAPTKLRICEGSRVMMVFNFDVEAGIANGTTGRVIGFRRGLPIVTWDNGMTMTVEKNTWKFSDDENVPRASYIHLPLMPADATTIHKSQGLTIAKVRVGLRGVFDLSQIYVALSRVCSLEDLQIVEAEQVDYNKIKGNQQVINWYENVKN